jgi:hypothetical protein
MSSRRTSRNRGSQGYVRMTALLLTEKLETAREKVLMRFRPPQKGLLSRSFEGGQEEGGKRKRISNQKGIYRLILPLMESLMRASGCLYVGMKVVLSLKKVAQEAETTRQNRMPDMHACCLCMSKCVGRGIKVVCSTP